jgi:hypothetical protein
MTEVAERRVHGQTRAKATKLPPKLRALTRDFKQGFTLERTGGGHYRVRDRRGELVTDAKGKNITLVGDPSPGVEQAIRRELTAAQVLKGTADRISERSVQERAERNRRQLEERRTRRSEEARILRERLQGVVEPLGGFELPGLAQDLGRVAHPIAREQGKHTMTPDLLSMSARQVMGGGWTEPRYQEVWFALIEQLEAAPDKVGEWFNRVREARGLPADVVELRMPAQGEWPFRVELLSLDALLIDQTYQRPVSWPFVRREAARFDPALVGTIDVAQRGPGRYAVLDGQQRAEICRMVGKSGIWASIYQGLDLASEARFFLHKNRDRKSVHPFYTFRARVAANDVEAIRIDELVKKHGYKVAIGAPGIGKYEDHVSAISALEQVYRLERPGGGDALDPTLHLLKRATFGRKHGQNNVIIRGVGRTFARYGPDELDDKVLVEVVHELGPDLLLGRARDQAQSLRSDTGGAAAALMRVLVAEYNRRVGRSGRLKLEE